MNAPTHSSDPTAPARLRVELPMAVLFADVVGSTRLYETFGDAQAKRMIDECLMVMQAVVRHYGGRVVKTIGDEIMVVLPSADAACLAATDIHHKIMALPMVDGSKRSVRIGFHFGPVIEEAGDVFGDTVNVAARMASLAKGLQIITTGQTVSCLSAMLQQSTRSIAALSVKGKGDEVAVAEVIWQGGEELTMSTASIASQIRAATLHLDLEGRRWTLEAAQGQLLLGRDAQCDVVLADRNASRQHARIERRRDKFFLVDQSTNGTFVAFANEPQMTLRREEVMLRGNGCIALGHAIEIGASDLLYFTVRE